MILLFGIKCWKNIQEQIKIFRHTQAQKKTVNKFSKKVNVWVDQPYYK